VEATQGYYVWREHYSMYIKFSPYIMILLLNPRWLHPYEHRKWRAVQFGGRVCADTGHLNAMLRENAANPGHTDRESITLCRGMRKFMRERGRSDVKIKIRVWGAALGRGR
jgi:hypothetical protein